MRSLGAHARLWLLALLLLATPALAREEILQFASEVRVQPDSSLLVRETITVRALGYDIRRGIYRDFPLRFRLPDGKEAQVGFRVIEVLRDGKPENWFTQRAKGMVRIYAGRKNVLLEPGIYTYTFVYHTTRQIRYFEGHDELYWNVTGHGWIFPILRASFVAYLPRPVPVSGGAVYTGPPGANNKDARIIRQGAGVFVAQTTKTLPPGEGFTIAFAFPKGVVRADAHSWKARLSEHLPLNWLLGGMVLVNAFFLWHWVKVGRDPRKGPIVPRWEAPGGLSPAATAWLDGEHRLGIADDERSLIAALVSLAVKGLVKLSDMGTSESSITRTRAREDLPPLPAGERLLMERLFADGERTFRMIPENAETFRKLKRDFLKTLNKEHEERLLRHNIDIYMAGVMLMLALLGGVAVAAWWQGSALGVMLMIVSAILGVLAMLLLPYFTWSLASARRGRHTDELVLVVIIGSAIVFIFTIWLRGNLEQHGVNDMWGAILPLILSAPISLMAWQYLIRRPTLLGRRILDELEGLRMFIRTAEERRLNADGGPSMSEAQFERLLPYAIALGEEEPWTRAFEKWLKQQPGGRQAWRPGWHDDNTSSSGRISDFGSSLVNGINSSMGSMVPSHSSSGSGGSGSFGGGGSSGGGGGGGGGGGW